MHKRGSRLCEGRLQNAPTEHTLKATCYQTDYKVMKVSLFLRFSQCFG